MSTPMIASLSLDLDNKWAYLRAAGREDWETADSYLPLAIDRLVDTLGPIGLPVSVFLVGRDLANQHDVQAIGSLDRLPQWEAANHSLNHLPWMHTMSEAEIRDEVLTTHHRIVEQLDRVPRGFRGPGFSCPAEVLHVLLEAGYAYDASVFPTSMAPIARAVFMARTRLRGEQRRKAKQLYGGFASMRQPNVPHRRGRPSSAAPSAAPSAPEDTLWEVPVTVMPWTRTPIHFSYVTFLASHSLPLAKAYFQTALSLCRRSGVAPSLLLHPPDFLGREDDADLAYLPGMTLTVHRKLEFMRWALTALADQFDVRTMIDQLIAIDPSLSPVTTAGSPSTPPGAVPSPCSSLGACSSDA